MAVVATPPVHAIRPRRSYWPPRSRRSRRHLRWTIAPASGGHHRQRAPGDRAARSRRCGRRNQRLERDQRAGRHRSGDYPVNASPSSFEDLHAPPFLGSLLPTAQLPALTARALRGGKWAQLKGEATSQRRKRLGFPQKQPPFGVTQRELTLARSTDACSTIQNANFDQRLLWGPRNGLGLRPWRPGLPRGPQQSPGSPPSPAPPGRGSFRPTRTPEPA